MCMKLVDKAGLYDNESQYKHFPPKTIDLDLSVWAAINT